MKIEKKLVALSILTIAIGIATIVPLQYLMTEAAVGTVRPLGTQVQNTPWFNVDIPYAYVDTYDAAGNNTMTWDGATFQAIVNITLTPDAQNLKDADAKVEYYQFHIYSDQGSIANITSSIAVGRGEKWIPEVREKPYYAISGCIGDTIIFADGTTYNASAYIEGDIWNGGYVRNVFPGEDIEGLMDYTVSTMNIYIADYNGEKSVQALSNLRNAQTLYIDVTRILAVSYQENSSSTTTTTLTTREVLYHVELAKIGDEFVYGTYTPGVVPFPMRVPNGPKDWTGQYYLQESWPHETPKITP